MESTEVVLLRVLSVIEVEEGVVRRVEASSVAAHFPTSGSANKITRLRISATVRWLLLRVLSRYAIPAWIS